MTTNTSNTSNTMSWVQVGLLILAFLILCVSMPLGLSQPVGDLRTACGIAAVASLAWLTAAIWYGKD